MVRSRSIIWSPAAEDDFTSILEYLQQKWSPKIINRFIQKVDDSITLILEDPKTFPVINEEFKVRKCVITKQNTLYYRAISTNIEIVRLFDSRQAPDKLEFY